MNYFDTFKLLLNLVKQFITLRKTVMNSFTDHYVKYFVCCLKDTVSRKIFIQIHRENYRNWNGIDKSLGNISRKRVYDLFKVFSRSVDKSNNFEILVLKEPL